jgi:hypothetical protein
MKPLVGKNKIHLRSIALVAGVAFGASVHAVPVVYTTSTDNDSDFFAYDTTAGTWSQKASISSRSQLASDRHGSVYSYATDDTIKRYDAVTNTWASVASGPGGIQNSNSNLEVLNDGRYFLSTIYSSTYHVYDGSSWSSGSLGFSAAQTGDFDHETNQLVIGQRNVETVHLLDVTTFSATTYSNGSQTTSERKRAGSLLNGVYYQKYSTDELRSLDLSSTSNSFQDVSTGNQNIWYPSSAADRENDLLYILGIGGSSSRLQFEAYDVNADTFTTLATMPSGLGFHSTAIVGGVSVGGPPAPAPAPATLALLGLGLIGGFVVRKKRSV